MSTLLFIFGTRPEHIKLHSVLDALRPHAHRLNVHIAFTGQHPDLINDLDDFNGSFTSHRLPDVMQHNQPINLLLASILTHLDPLIATLSPSLILVQGDTTSALAGALAASHRRIPLAHIEAGLRTPRLDSPFPEEANRRLISTLATWHYAPTTWARQNLLREHHDPARVIVTGNTSIDRLHTLRHTPLPDVARDGRAVLMTLHRRENVPLLPALLKGLRDVLHTHPDVHIVWPRHPNPKIREVSERLLGRHARVTLLDALSHAECVAWLKSCQLVLTDSGGLQEEAITFGVPVVVLRAYTDRPEGITHGLATLAGGDVSQMLRAIDEALKRPAMERVPCAIYGDGDAGLRIAEHLIEVVLKS